MAIVFNKRLVLLLWCLAPRQEVSVMAIVFNATTRG